MPKPHKHAELIKKWADGAVIQYRVSGLFVWTDTTEPKWRTDNEYRVKPETKKYRVALFKWSPENQPSVSVTDNKEREKTWENLSTFVRWLTDWVEYEV